MRRDSTALFLSLFLVLALWTSCGDDDAKKAAGSSCEADDECSSGVCFESACYTACTEQATCAADEFCVALDRNGAASMICRPQAAHAGCASHADCEDLLSGPCDSVRCATDRGLCEVAPVEDGEPCNGHAGAGECQDGSCVPEGVEPTAEVSAPRLGDCVAELPEKTLFQGESLPQQVTIVTNPSDATVTTYSEYKPEETIVVDKNADGTYLVTTGAAWAMIEASHGEIVDHETWFEWTNAPIDTALSITLRNTASGHSVTILFSYDAEGVTLTSVCFEEGAAA